MSTVLDHAMALMACPSVTPNDAGCQDYVADVLQRCGWQVRRMRIDDTDNLWATLGDGSPVLAFAGHTDVVPPGPEGDWTSPPFAPEVRDGKLYGRGACDMKGAIAAFLAVCESLHKRDLRPDGTLAVLLTSDEEGTGRNGTRAALQRLWADGVRIDGVLVGEPSASSQAGDTLRPGRRGSLSARITVPGRQGHVAYPEAAINPIHRAVPVLDELARTQWDQADDTFPATSLQIVWVEAGVPGGSGYADNVIAPELRTGINFRFRPGSPAETLQARVEDLFERHGIDDAVFDWTLSAEPFVTTDPRLLGAAEGAVTDICGQPPASSTAGGTSDGRFFAALGVPVVELGLPHGTAHAVDECVALDDLDRLTLIYERLVRRYFGL
ncbi:MAG: succinyl-diaminopimelate desuccinylase [Candidatus Dadabacteria bacterium]|nr:MAG: succinyl-diaminopimelate desuccinylase [Candidatus Dadabacteria bacterium]